MTISIPETTPLDEATLRQAEFRLKCELPSAFRTFVAKHNGAEPQDNTFKTKDNESGVRRFIPISEAAILREQIEGFPTTVIPIAEDDCGNYVYLHEKTGQIHFWDHEAGGAGEVIAEDFMAFLRLVQPFDPSTLPKPKVIRAWIKPGFNPEFD